MMAPATRKLRALELGRVSTCKQDLERQELDLEDNREEFGLEPIKTFWLKESGEKVLSTKEWAEVEAELKRVRPDVLSVSAVDRIARPQNMQDFARFQVFIDLKIAIASKREKLIEPWTPLGRKTLTAALLQAGNELSDLKDRLASNRRKQHKQNKPMNVTPPFGILYRDKYSKDAEGRCQYFYEDLTPASNGESRRAIVEMVFHWRYVEHMKIHRIVKRLNGLGILTGGLRKKDGSWQFEPGLWSRDTVKQLLRN
ncbi:MAG TPA: recombinase family protein, partial [Gemmataceae bacterium]